MPPKLTIDCLLPELAEALSGHESVEDPELRRAFCELNLDLVVPVMTLRRDAVMSDFSALGPSGEQLSICGQDESIRQARLVLGALWQWAEEAATRSPDVKRKKLDKARDDYLALPEESAVEAKTMAAALKGQLASAAVELEDDLLARVLCSATTSRSTTLFGSTCRAGQVTVCASPVVPHQVRRRLYPASRRSQRIGELSPLAQAIDSVVRTMGQEPDQFAVPVWMSSLCRSYHFQMSAPPSTYFVSRRFPSERNSHQSGGVRQAAFTEYCKTNDAHVGGWQSCW